MRNIFKRLFNFSVPQSETEFLPAALEVVETPPSPIGRAILWNIIAVTCFLVAWACVGRTDVIAVGTGKIIPSEQVKEVSLLDDGVIKRILVDEGQYIEKGELLIEMDSDVTQSDIETYSHELLQAKYELAKIQTLMNWDPSQPIQAFLSFEKSPQNILLANLYQKQIKEEAQSMQLQLNRLDSEMDNLTANYRAEEHRIKKLEETLLITSKWSQALKKLYADGMGSEYDWLQQEQKRITDFQDLQSSKETLKQLAAQKRSLESYEKQLVTDFQKDLLSRKAETVGKIERLTALLAKATKIKKFQNITSPVAGNVQQLVVHTIGGIIKSGTPVLTIVPKNSPIEVEAFIQNKDIGFVHEGQQAEIKLEAFPSSEYGTIKGKVKSVSSAAIADENLGLVYLARIMMDTPYINAGDKKLSLIPGMAATVEIKLRKRRIIEYFLSPLLKYKQESFHER